MLIDWFTVGAQVLNFLVLAWLLKRFLYRPILDAIDAREKRIAAKLADADAKKAEALKERDDFGKKNAEFDRQRATLLAEARDQADAERRRILEDTRKAEARQLNQALARCARDEVFAISRKALSELASTSLEERLGEIFTQRLRDIDPQSKAALGDVLRSAAKPALVRSAFDLPAAQRAAIQNALNETFSAEIRVQFETAPDLVSGIELVADGRKLGWSIAHYLASLEERVESLLKDRAKFESGARPGSEPASR